MLALYSNPHKSSLYRNTPPYNPAVTTIFLLPNTQRQQQHGPREGHEGLLGGAAVLGNSDLQKKTAEGDVGE